MPAYIAGDCSKFFQCTSQMGPCICYCTHWMIFLLTTCFRVLVEVVSSRVYTKFLCACKLFDKKVSPHDQLSLSILSLSFVTSSFSYQLTASVQIKVQSWSYSWFCEIYWETQFSNQKKVNIDYSDIYRPGEQTIECNSGLNNLVGELNERILIPSFTE